MDRGRPRSEDSELGPFGEDLQGILIAKGISQTELSAASGLKSSTISSMKSGSRLSRENVLRVIKGLVSLHAIASEYEVNRLLRSASLEELDGYRQEDAGVQDLLRLQQTSSSLPSTDRAMQLGPIFGRDEDIGMLLHLLPKNRLTTLTGAAGVGKTRLALEVMNRLKGDPSYACAYISFASLETSISILSAITWGLGIVKGGDDPASLGTYLLSFIQTEQFLLILDNFEHVLDSTAKDILTILLEKCPKMKILVTSRIILHIEYEYIYRVKTLFFPLAHQVKEPSDLAHYPATELFLHVAHAKGSLQSLTEEDAAKVIDICRNLDGLPLAIRIVASKLSKLTLQEIYEKLLSIEALTLPNHDTELKRQRTLLETFDWSYRLLSAEQQILFQNLAVFTDGCSYEAVRIICEAKDEDIWALIDSSLVGVEHEDGISRLRILRPIYEYARDRLNRMPSKKQVARLRRFHRNYFFKLAEASESKLRSAGQLEYFRLIEKEWENIQTAFEYTLNEKRSSEMLLRFAGGLWWYWRLSMKNRLGKTGREWLNKIFEHQGVKAFQKIPTLAQERPKIAAWYAKALYIRVAAGAAASPPINNIMREEEIYKSLVKILEMFNELGNIKEAIVTTIIASEVLPYSNVVASFEETCKVIENENDIWHTAWVYMHQGCLSLKEGDFEKARAFFSKSTRLYEMVEDRRGVWEVKVNLEQLAQIEKIAQEGWGEWIAWPEAMEEALKARILRKKIDLHVGWHAYVDPEPQVIDLASYFVSSYKKILSKFPQAAYNDTRTRHHFPRPFLRLARDIWTESVMIIDVFYAAIVDLLEWFPNDRDLQDWLLGISSFSFSNSSSEVLPTREQVVSFLIHSPNLRPELYEDRQEQHIPSEYPHLVQRLRNLAEFYKELERYQAAESLYWRGLEICERYIGSIHPDVATILNLLGVIYLEQSKHAQAEPLLRRALSINESCLGSAHPDTQTVLNNLATLYFEQKQYRRAEPLWQRIVAINEQTREANHLKIAGDLTTLAYIYLEQNEFLRAEPLYQRALSIYQQRLGSTHPDTALVLNNFAMCYIEQGKYSQAEPLLQQAMAVERALGKDREESIITSRNLARVYQMQDQYDKAEPLWESILQIDEQRHKDHLKDSAIVLSNLAACYIKQKKYDQADPLLERIIKIYEQQLLSYNFTTIHDIADLMYFYQE